MKKGVIISGISCLILLGTVGAITAGKILIDNKQETVTETSTYQSKEINHALATGDEVVGSWDVSEKGDGSVTATLYGDGKMVISGNGNMKNYYNSSDRPYDRNRTNIKIVEIQNGVTSIGSSAFRECSSLTSIEIPNSVISIGNYAFYGCSSLTSINVEKDNKNYISENGILFNKDKTEIICYPAGKNDIISYTIPNTITSIGSSTFSGCSSLTNIEIPASVTSIGSGAFENCRSLTSIEIPNSVTRIGYYAFRGCRSLTSIEIPSSVTSIESFLFEYCIGLTSIEIPSSVISIGEEAFKGCSSLKSIIIPNSVTSIGDLAFQICSSLTSIEIPSSVTSIGRAAFFGCSSLTSINVEKDNKNYISENGILFNKDKTEIICYPAGKKDIISYTIPNTITSIGSYAFYGCKVLARIIIPNTITSIGNSAFSECSSLTIYCEANSVAEQYAKDNKINYTTESIDKDNINIIGTWNVSATEKDNVIATLYDDGKLIISGTGNMKNYSSSSRPYYNKRTSIVSVEIQNGVTSIGDDALNVCSSLTSINVEKDNKNYISENGILFNKDKTKIICYPAGKNDIISYTIPNNITSIGEWAFYGCSSLTSIEIPSSVISIGDYAFYYCKSLINIAIPSSVTSIGQFTFSECSSLTSIEIPSSVTKIEYNTFSGCSSLISIEIPSSVTRIVDYAFYNCTSLTSIEIPNSVKWIGKGVFKYCSSLKSINVEKNNENYSSENGILFNKDKTKIICYPAGKKDIVSYTIPNTVTSIGDDALNECSSLTSIEIPNSVTRIGDYAFQYCRSLESIKIPSSVTSIGSSAFRQCSSLTSIEIPNSVISIGNYAFYGCSSLTSIEIPNSVTGIGDYAFNGCSSLKSIIIPEGVTSISMNAFANCTNLTAVMLPESLTSIGSWIFYGCTNVTIYSKKNSTADGNIKLDGVAYINIYNAQPKTTLSNFMKNESLNSTDSRILDKDNKELKATDLITTGTSVNNTVEEEIIPYIVLVTGDTNGDGQADLKDILAINKHRLNKAQLTDEYLFSGDVNKDGRVDIKDLLQINKFRLGKINSL